MDPIAFLFSLERLGMKFGLASMTALCDALGNPQQSFRSIIVGGTNGKGSVTAMVSRALSQAGHRTARYTSPHLERLEERFVVDEREVEPGDLRDAAGEVQQAALALVARGTLTDPPTFFECATAIAFVLFRRRGVSAAVLEVGLGGRLDATNVVDPVVAAITSIDFDHQAQLGGDLESIAREKAGIIKPGIAVVCGPLPIEADRLMVATCLERGARLIRALERVSVRRDDPADAGESATDGPLVAFRSARHHLPPLRLALRGLHQVANAAVALCLLEELDGLGLAVPETAIVAALTGVRWPARLEHRTWQGADLLLDAAHNPAGARALASYLDETGWSRPPGATLVFGAMKDKDVAGILAPLLRGAGRVICTTAASPRAMPAADLAGLARSILPDGPAIESLDDAEAALRAACQPGARVVVAGSIFLVGPLRGILR